MNIQQLGIPFHALYSYKSGTCKVREAVFKCHCGKIFITRLMNGNRIQSCGCIRDKACANRCKIHNSSYHPLYRTWKSMMLRCYNEKNQDYHNYGGRGITVCDRWHDVKNFILDMGEKSYGQSLDRVNNDLGYSEENCRWASNLEQSRNKRSNTLLTINGITKCTKEWSEHDGVTAKYHTICKRLENGWDPERAVFTNPRAIRRNK